VVLSPEHSVRDALAVINAEALRVCLVVDKEQHLLGVVTDGDIRRAILSNVSLTQSVTTVMNPTPITVSAKLTREQLLETMRARRLHKSRTMIIPYSSWRGDLVPGCAR